AIMMVIVSVLDIAFGTAVSWVFSGITPANR
ncbi:MAG TPA: preprotein translocase subunit SecE, partial [Arthrobacter bacterium]|nr:preprotein translocase subunit SecE [Arthrobacter sp.]